MCGRFHDAKKAPDIFECRNDWKRITFHFILKTFSLLSEAKIIIIEKDDQTKLQTFPIESEKQNLKKFETFYC